MRREDDRALAAEGPDEAPDLDDLSRIEADGGLVEDEDGRVVDKGLREADPLPVSFGEVAEQAIADLSQATGVEDALERDGDVPPSQPLQLRDEAEIARHAHVVVEGRILGKIPDPTPYLGRLLEDVEAVDPHRARGRRQEAGDDPHGRRLSGAVGAEKAEDLPGSSGEGDVADGSKLAVALGQARDFDHRVGLDDRAAGKFEGAM